MKRAGIVVALGGVVVVAVLAFVLWPASEPPQSTAVDVPSPPPLDGTTAQKARPLAQQTPPVQQRPSESSPAQPSSPARQPEPLRSEPAPAPRTSKTSDLGLQTITSLPSASSEPEVTSQTPSRSRPKVVPRVESAAREQGPVEAAPPPVRSPVVPTPKPALIAPSFDVVRVEPSGETVVAGRAAPGSTVTLLDGERRLGSATADARGQWVIVLDTPLAPGDHALGLESRTADGQVALSQNLVVVSVPTPQIAAVTAESRSAVRDSSPRA